MHNTFSRFLTWFCKDSAGKWKVIQLPNVPLAVWLVLTVMSAVLHDGTLKQGISALRDAVLFTWSYLEITAGDSRFRRLLGAVVMTLLVIKFF